MRTIRLWGGGRCGWGSTAPRLLRMQLRALIAAAAGRPLQVMFPLVATVDEFRAARALVEREVAWAERRGRPAPARLEVGAMIEAPSLLWHLDALLPLTDFVSVGTNDLMQYLFAADRGNPARVGALRSVVAARAPRLEGDPRCMRRYRHAGFRSAARWRVGRSRRSRWSRSGSSDCRCRRPGIGPVKQMVLSCDRGAARKGIDGFFAQRRGIIAR